MKLSDLKTARQVRREDSWQVKILYAIGWPKNQVEILRLKWNLRRRRDEQETRG